jgi:folate-binding protein YgfZ
MEIQLNHLRFNSYQVELKNWSLIKVQGTDSLKFFNGQTTNDLIHLKNHESKLTARLSRNGKLQSFFYYGLSTSAHYLLCPKELVQKIFDDLTKFIIMDDVEMTLLQDTPWLIANNDQPIAVTGLFEINMFGFPAHIALSKNETLELHSEEELEALRKLNGFPKWGENVNESAFINDTFLNEIGISYKKGCFLGQETVAKIENNRGAAYYPMLLELEQGQSVSREFEGEWLFIGEEKIGKLTNVVGTHLIASLNRDQRVLGKKITFKIQNTLFKAEVKSLPYFGAQTKEEIARELYHQAVSFFQNNEVEKSLVTLKRCLFFDRSYSDAYEVIGVILGRLQKYEEAVTWMDQLLQVNNKSVLAHTNKSLFFMRLGKIEEAEAEKALATVKSFAVFGEEAQIKKKLEEEKLKKLQDMEKREKMFLQVLEIDPEDSVALYGLADIFFSRGKYHEAILNLEKVVAYDEKYSVAYVLLGKGYLEIKEKARAQETFEKGIKVATQRGDMMPANEMQSLLNNLNS